MTNQQWCVYALECGDGSIYVGVTDDLQSRLKAHSSGKGSKYVRSRLPFKLLGTIDFGNDKIEAMKEEYRIKHLSRKEKIKLFVGTKEECNVVSNQPRM